MTTTTTKTKTTRLTSEQKAAERVVIAKDVLAQIKVKRLIPVNGTYLDANTLVTTEDKDKELQQLLKAKPCDVCALGSLFVARIDKKNELKLNDCMSYLDDLYPRTGTSLHVSREIMVKYLSKVFTVEQMNLIENEFERDRLAGTRGFRSRFAPAVYDSEDRLRLIMENIVVNGGTFVRQMQPVVNKNGKWCTTGYRPPRIRKPQTGVKPRSN